MHLHKVTLVGIGLLGGSLGLALQRRKLASLVTGCVRRPESVDECVQLGVVHEATCDLRRGVEEADLVVLCTPIGAMHETARSLAPLLKPGAVVTDVGSVKEPVVKDLEPLLARHDVHFVGSHPMAGAEKTGPAASKADLFQDAVCVVTPTTRSKPEAVKLVEDLWRAVGAKVLRRGLDHDR